MTVDEFFSVCARMGFSRCGKGYARCLGDGVYQELSAPGTGYLSHSSPEFLQWRRRSPVVELRLRSMYADPAYFRTPQITFYPEDLVGGRYVSGDYQGFANQCDLMLSVGFAVLDTVTTQARLLEWSRKLEAAQYPEETPDRSEPCHDPLRGAGDGRAGAECILYPYLDGLSRGVRQPEGLRRI